MDLDFGAEIKTFVVRGVAKTKFHRCSAFVDFSVNVACLLVALGLVLMAFGALKTTDRLAFR